MRPSGPGGAEATGGDTAIMPSPRLLLGSMVCNAAVGHRLAAKVEREGWLEGPDGDPDLFQPSIAAPCCGDGRNKSGHDVERPYLSLIHI